jgi:two-component system OmpR family sensor kinase
LFWKVFFAFWLAQLMAGAGVGTVVWLRHQAEAEETPRPEPFHRGDLFLEAAGAVLRHGGVAALQDWLQAREGQPGPPIYAVDESGREILGRTLPAEASAQAALGAGGQRVAAGDGHAYVLLAPWADGPIGGRPPPPPEGFPPGAPPDRPPGQGPPPARPPSPALLAGVGVLASLSFSAWLGWYLAKPIRKLRAAFDALAEGRLDIRVGPAMGARRDELSGLARNFDHMAGRIGALVGAQRRLLHDVSHELRSPLARLQVAVGLARQQPDKLAASLGRIEREAERLDALVGELLALSRLEAGVPDGAEAAVDMAALLAEIVEDARFEAEAKGVRVESDGIGGAAVRGRAELLRCAVENVVRNAIQHAPAGSRVGVGAALAEDSRELRLSVCDQGPGVPEAQLAAIFEPFFRGAGRAGGAGLGLAIARRAVEAHGGKISARNRAEGGLCVELALPAAQAGSP